MSTPQVISPIAQARVDAIHCRRCGAVLAPAEIANERVLVLAACCPRCDGPLDAAGPDADGARE